jgi:hypothetical protein
MDKRYVVRSPLNPKLVLCTDGELHVESQVGPGGYCAKVFKTERGAKAALPGRSPVVETISG